ncbi:INTS12 [Mytilus edulis]|uniref:Integrator complex subunit 12 n=1 Tax=Mytilus edulis TaxID=6550 RepID=A0A8S3QFN2_MYTED|nr:INTS12 [Mytilus edulis]
MMSLQKRNDKGHQLGRASLAREKREAEKRTLEKVKKEPRDPDDDVIIIPEKKARHSSPQPPSKPKKDHLQPEGLPSLSRPKKESPQPGRSPSHDVRIKEEVKEEKQKHEKKSKEEDMDADEFAFGLGISCVVCKSFDVTSRNQLVECQECHSLYHQECHKPPVTEQDVNDPRFVWYCCKCSKNMKKMVQSKTTKTKQPSISSEKDSTASSNKTAKSDPTSLFSFRRVDPKVSTSKDQSNNAGAKPLSGLASLAANLSGKSEQSKSSSQIGKTEQSKSSSQLGKSEQSKSSSQSVKSEQSKSSLGKSDSSKFGSQLTKLDQVKTSQSAKSDGSKSSSHGAKFSGKAESSKSTVTPKLDFMKTLSSKLSPDTIKASMKPSIPKPEQSKPGTSSSSKSSMMAAPSKSHQPQGGASAVVNAEKKLQMMKKKAAAKLQEKRTSLK